MSSISNIIFLIYGNNEKSIISYNLINKEKINEIKNAHQNNISNIRHHLDKFNKRDLFLSISSKDYNVKVWNVTNFQCLLNLNNIDTFYSNKHGYIYSACFLANKNQNYIITSDCSPFLDSPKSGPIKIFDLNGNLIKEIKGSNDYNTLFIDTYFDEKKSNNYIISGNCGFIESYDYNNDKIYHKYTHFNGSNNKNPFGLNTIYCYESIIITTLDDINNEKTILKLIASCSDGFIKIWNFHSGEILKVIKVFGVFLHSICLINNNYLAVGCGDKSIKIVDIKKGKVIKVLIGDATDINCIKSINHPNFGICLLTKGNTQFRYNDNIKLWGNKKYYFGL